MIWLQTLPAFAIWLAYIFLRRKWTQQSRERYARLPRYARIARMLASIFASVAILFGGIFVSAKVGWCDTEGLTVPGFLVITAAGLAFIHLQMLATALTLSLALDRETDPTPSASNPQIPPGDTP